MSKARILIADDHNVVREGIRAVLSTTPDYRIVGEAQNGEEAVSLARELRPDVTIMDISMPKLNGLEATALIKKENPAMKVIILTVHEDEEYVYQMLRAGASGYVLKSAGRKEILAALQSALSGERFFSPGVSKMIVDSFVKRASELETPPAKDKAEDQQLVLTNRETEVLTYIAKGYTNRKIAETLFLSVRTVNTHRTNLMNKLDIHDTATLVRYAMENGLVKDERVQSRVLPH